MNDQPNPTTGEWTVDGDFIRDGGNNLLLSLKAIVEAHNAALAASDAIAKSWYEHTVRCEEQLVAERETIENLHKILGKKRTEIKLLQETICKTQKP